MTQPPGHVLIAANPKSGSGSSTGLVAQLKTALEQHHLTCEIITDLQQLQTAAQRLSASGNLRAVVSAGGDGTASALANLLGDQTPILVFPLGTENLLAKYLELTTNIDAAVRAILDSRHETIDVGTANGQLFLVMLSVGFDAQVVREMTAMRTGHINRWSYAKPIFKAIRRYDFPRLRTRLTGSHDSPQPSQHDASWLFLFNVPRYAAALDFCPQADPSDGLLDLCTFDRPGVTRGLGYLARLWLGKHQTMNGFQHQTCRELEIEAVDSQGNPATDVPYQLDGDFGGVLPLKVSLIPKRLKLIVAKSKGDKSPDTQE